MIVDYTAEPGAKPVRLLFDNVAFGRGRTGVSFSFSIAYAHRAVAHAAEVRMAQSLDSRIRV